MKQQVLRLGGSLLTGGLLAAGFPGYGHSTVMFVALVPLMFAVQAVTAKRAAVLSWLSGLAFFALSLSWLCNMTRTVEDILFKTGTWCGYLLLAVYCGLYAIPFGMTVALAAPPGAGTTFWKNVRLMVAVTAVWTGSEYLRGILLTGFPWNALGVSQYTNPVVIQVADWGGVSAVSAMIVWMNAGVFATLRRYASGTRIRSYRPHGELMLGILPLALAVAYGMNVLSQRIPPHDEIIRVALVQPNIPQKARRDAQMDIQICQQLEGLTATACRRGQIDLVVWPETALPGLVRIDPSRRALVRRVTSSGTALLAGSMDYSNTPPNRIYYNGSLLFGATGTLEATYHKQHLVPFGEYIPLPHLLRFFTPLNVDFGRGSESTVFPLAGKGSFSALICFEDTIAALAPRAVRSGARWLINQTNDAWFDPSAQSEQHLAHAVFRCVENRIPMARCCNTGVTCTIDAYGRIQRQLKVRTSGFAVSEIYPRQIGMKKTFYTRHGERFAQSATGIGGLMLAELLLYRRRFVPPT